jgi:hypothetical protein
MDKGQGIIPNRFSLAIEAVATRLPHLARPDAGPTTPA